LLFYVLLNDQPYTLLQMAVLHLLPNVWWPKRQERHWLRLDGLSVSWLTISILAHWGFKDVNNSDLLNTYFASLVGW